MSDELNSPSTETEEEELDEKFGPMKKVTNAELQKDMFLLKKMVEKKDAENELLLARLSAIEKNQVGGLDKGNEPVTFSDKEIDDFLASERPSVFFSPFPGGAISLFPSRSHVDVTTGRMIETPGVFIDFQPWIQIGSEIVDPADKNKKRPLFMWSFIDLSVFCRDQKLSYTLNEIIEAMRASTAFSAKTIFDFNEGKRRIGQQYAKIRAQREIDKKFELMSGQLPPDILKTGNVPDIQ